MKMKYLFLLLCVISLPAYAAGDANAGKAKSATCAACHGPDGNSVAPNYPKIAGQHYRYLVDQLKSYKKGAEGPRHGAQAAIMYGMVAQLSDQDIENLAAYYSSQKTSPGATDKALLELGEKLYKGGDLQAGIAACAACHGPRGDGNELAKYPKLSGQNAQYLEDQLHAFIRGDRQAPSGMMRGIARKMSDKQIKAVSSYASGLH